MIFAALIVLAVTPYVQTLHHGFVNFDDNLQVTDNPIVQRGLTWSGVRWAWTTFHAFNWHPLTWLSLPARMANAAIGLFLAIVWSIPQPVSLKAQRAWAGLAGVALAVLAALSTRQVAHWRDSRTLFTHALAVTSGNFMAHQNLGMPSCKRVISMVRWSSIARPSRCGPTTPWCARTWPTR